MAASSPSPPMASPEASKRVSLNDSEKRNRAVREIYDTEKSYVASLELLVKYYLKPMRQQNILPKPKVAFIFGNVEHILIINRELMEALEKRIVAWDDDSVLGDVMNKLIPWLRLYSEYCSNYHNVTAFVLKMMTKASFADFLNKQKDTNNILDLASLLIMPIQRIPRYKLLLEQVVKFTPETHHDYKALTNALERVSEVAELVNESVRKKQNLEQLAELEKKLMGKYPKNMAQTGRVLIHEGELTKLCRKVPKQRYFFLFNDLLLYGVANPLNRTYIIHRTISLLTGRIIPVDDSDKVKNGFKIISKEKSFLVWADTPEDKRIWTAKIEAAKESLKQNPHTTGGEGFEEYEAPIWQNDEESNTCTLCQINFTTLRRKHHCRKCGKLVCGKCSEHRYELPNIGKERVCDDCFADLSGQPSKRKALREKMGSATDVLSPRLNEMGLVHNRNSAIEKSDCDAQPGQDPSTSIASPRMMHALPPPVASPRLTHAIPTSPLPTPAQPAPSASPAAPSSPSIPPNLPQPYRLSGSGSSLLPPHIYRELANKPLPPPPSASASSSSTTSKPDGEDDPLPPRSGSVIVTGDAPPFFTSPRCSSATDVPTKKRVPSKTLPLPPPPPLRSPSEGSLINNFYKDASPAPTSPSSSSTDAPSSPTPSSTSSSSPSPSQAEGQQHLPIPSHPLPQPQVAAELLAPSATGLLISSPTLVSPAGSIARPPKPNRTPPKPPGGLILTE